MDLKGPIPFQAAAAYGLPATRKAPPAPEVLPAAPEPAAKTPRPVDVLVAGTVRSDVNRGIGFDGDAPTPPSMAMYSRTAERLEASTRVALGKTLDITA